MVASRVCAQCGAVFTPQRIAAVFGVDATIIDTDVGPLPILRRPL